MVWGWKVMQRKVHAPTSQLLFVRYGFHSQPILRPKHVGTQILTTYVFQHCGKNGKKSSTPGPWSFSAPKTLSFHFAWRRHFTRRSWHVVTVCRGSRHKSLTVLGFSTWWPVVVAKPPAQATYCSWAKRKECFGLWVLCIYCTSSTAQGGGGSFKNRKPIGEVGCCESRMAGRIHWWTETWLRPSLFLYLSLSFSDYLPTYLPIYLCIYVSTYLPIYLSI
jgi:hypothetical protein